MGHGVTVGPHLQIKGYLVRRLGVPVGIMNVAPCFNPDCEGSLILPPPSLKLESHCNFASFLLNIYKICILGGVRGRRKCIVIFAEVVLN